MKITFDQTAEDLIDFNYYYSWLSPEKATTRRLRPLIPFLVFVVLIIARKGVRFHRYGWAEYLILAFGLLFAAFYSRLIKWNSRLIVKKLIAGGKNASMLGSKTLVFEENEVVAVTATSRSQISWTAFEKCIETNERFFLFLHLNQAIVVPKKAFEDRYQMDAFRKIISKKIK
jgi:hypothetical protein